MLKSIFKLVSLLVLSHVTALADENPTQEKHDIIEEKALIRIFSHDPQHKTNTAGYVILKNTSDSPIKFVTVSFTHPKEAFCETIELHTHIIENNKAQMHAVKEFEVPAQGALELKPGGNHIMFMGTTKSLNIGDSLLLALNFEKDGKSFSKDVTFKVVSHKDLSQKAGDCCEGK